MLILPHKPKHQILSTNAAKGFGASGVWNLIHGRTISNNLVTGIPVTNNNLAGTTVALSGNSAGAKFGANYNGVTSNYPILGESAKLFDLTNNKCTILILKRRVNTANERGGLCGASGGGGLAIQPHGSLAASSGSWHFYDRASGPQIGTTGIDAGFFSISRPHVIICTMDGTTLKTWQDGVQTASGTASTPVTPGANFALTMAGWDSFYGTDCDIALIATWKYAIDSSLCKELSKNPWQLLEPQKNYFLFDSSTGSVQLTVNSITNSQSIDNIALTQANTLVISNIAESQSFTNIDLIQNNLLNINNVNNTLSLENINLIQANLLTLSNISQVNSLDNIILTVAGTLVIANITNAEILENVSLVQNNTLQMQSITETNTLQNIVLTQANILNIQNVSNQITLENIILTSGDTLTIQNISQTITYTNIDLVQNNLLTIADLNNVQTLSNIDVIQSNILQVNSILNTQALGNITLNTSIAIDINNINQVQSLQNILLTQANLLTISNITQGNQFQNITLTSASTIIISDILHSQIMQNISLITGVIEINIGGKTIYVLKNKLNSNIFVLNSK